MGSEMCIRDRGNAKSALYRSNDNIADAFGQEPGAVNHGAGLWYDSGSLATKPKSVNGLATGYRIDCGNCNLFCLVVCLLYEKGDPFTVV